MNTAPIIPFLRVVEENKRGAPMLISVPGGEDVSRTIHLFPPDVKECPVCGKTKLCGDPRESKIRPGQKEEYDQVVANYELFKRSLVEYVKKSSNETLKLWMRDYEETALLDEKAV